MPLYQAATDPSGTVADCLWCQCTRAAADGPGPESADHDCQWQPSATAAAAAAAAPAVLGNLKSELELE